MEPDLYKKAGPVTDKELMKGLLDLEGKIALASAEEEGAKTTHKDAKDKLEQLREETHALLRARKKGQKVYLLTDGALTLQAPDKQQKLPLKAKKKAPAKKKRRGKAPR
jgi:hypothetical protein